MQPVQGLQLHSMAQSVMILQETCNEGVGTPPATCQHDSLWQHPRTAAWNCQQAALAHRLLGPAQPLMTIALLIHCEEVASCREQKPGPSWSLCSPVVTKSDMRIAMVRAYRERKGMVRNVSVNNHATVDDYDILISCQVHDTALGW